jgi:AraC family transcriptional regulator, alkane utilization regulator
LAREVALSRSALAGRFMAVVGEPPMRYLTHWRLMQAAQILRTGENSLARLAERSGYDSEAAFSRAFKREFGMGPKAWRNAPPGTGLDASARRFPSTGRQAQSR